jgi:hypothetical protein
MSEPDRDLLSLGFTFENGVLHAPTTCRVQLIPVDRYYEIRFSLDDGSMTVVVPRVALKVMRPGVKL